ncbi:hypothetical protein Vafri_2501 [Volvox africanus]|uniref:Uncharacterized protein n=1 Tax=Volvox africanus TaxID=51714 RepID=A0A8J4APL7_9CHLO|nr:hypothetical protein Vafri_2501 [Volvox africanus]
METESQYSQQLHGSLEYETRTLYPGLLSLVEGRLRSLDPTSADPASTADILGLLASVLQNACSGRVAPDYVHGPQDAMQDSVRLACTMVSWMAQGGAGAVASSTPETCSSLKDFVAAALDLASRAFFSPEWYQHLGPAQYMQTSNAVRGYVRDLAPVAFDATEACWRAVEQQLASGHSNGGELLEACRALFDALFEGLRHLGTTSAERINDPSVPREMRSFAGLNILWTGLSKIMTALPPEALQQLLSGCAVQSVLRALLSYLVSEVRATEASSPADYETRLKVSRFWLQHFARVTQAHPAAAAACWDELAAATAEVYGRIAAAGSAAAAAAAAAAEDQPNPPLPPAQHQQQPAGFHHQSQTQMARDLDSAIACKMTSLLALVLDAGCLEEGRGCGRVGSGASYSVTTAPPASPQQLEARLGKLEALARTGLVGCGATGGSTISPTIQPGDCSTVASSESAGPVLLCLALLQRAAHVSPEARAVMVSRLLPWAGMMTAVNLYGMALEQCGPNAVAPCLDLPHQLAAAALALLAAAAEQQQVQGGGQDVLSTLVQHCEPQLASSLIAAVARLAAVAAAAESVATVAAAVAGGAHLGSSAVSGGADEALKAPYGGVGGRLQRLLTNLLAAAPPQAEPAWREVQAQLAVPLVSSKLDRMDSDSMDCDTGLGGAKAGGPQHGAAAVASVDLCGAAIAKVLWGAAAGVAAIQAAAAAHSGGVLPGDGRVPGVPAVPQEDLVMRARQLMTAVRQAAALLGSLNAVAGGGIAARSTAAPATSIPTAIARQWLAHLLGCLEVTVTHMRHVGETGPAVQPLVSEVAELATQMLQLLKPAQLANNGAAPGTCRGDLNSSGAEMAAAHAAVRLIARSSDCVCPAALAALAPALTLLAQQGSPSVAADVAALAAYCNSPPPETLFHALLRNPHPAVLHVALQSQVHVCRTVPQQYAASVRRLFPPDFAPQAAVTIQPQPQPRNFLGGGAPPVHLAAVFKSYMSRKVPDDEVAVATVAAMKGRVAQGVRLAQAAREACACVSSAAPGGPPTAALALREAVNRGVESMQWWELWRPRQW